MDFHLKVFISDGYLDQMGHFFFRSCGSLGQVQNLDCFVLVILSNIAVTNNTGKIKLGHHVGHQV